MPELFGNNYYNIGTTENPIYRSAGGSGGASSGLFSTGSFTTGIGGRYEVDCGFQPARVTWFINPGSYRGTQIEWYPSAGVAFGQYFTNVDGPHKFYVQNGGTWGPILTDTGFSVFAHNDSGWPLYTEIYWSAWK